METKQKQLPLGIPIFKKISKGDDIDSNRSKGLEGVIYTATVYSLARPLRFVIAPTQSALGRLLGKYMNYQLAYYI